MQRLPLLVPEPPVAPNRAGTLGQSLPSPAFPPTPTPRDLPSAPNLSPGVCTSWLFHRNGVTRGLCLCVWLLSLSATFLRPIHAGGSPGFLLYGWGYPTDWLDRTLWIHRLPRKMLCLSSSYRGGNRGAVKVELRAHSDAWQGPGSSPRPWLRRLCPEITREGCLVPLASNPEGRARGGRRGAHTPRLQPGSHPAALPPACFL